MSAAIFFSRPRAHRGSRRDISLAVRQCVRFITPWRSIDSNQPPIRSDSGIPRGGLVEESIGLGIELKQAIAPFVRRESKRFEIVPHIGTEAPLFVEQATCDGWRRFPGNSGDQGVVVVEWLEDSGKCEHGLRKSGSLIAMSRDRLAAATSMSDRQQKASRAFKAARRQTAGHSWTTRQS